MNDLGLFALGAVAGAIGVLIILLVRRRVGGTQPRPLPQNSPGVATIDILAADLAHKLKNALGVMILNIGLMLEYWEKKHPDEPHAPQMIKRLQTLKREAQRLDTIAQDILRSANTIELKPHEVDLREVIRDLIESVSDRAKQTGIQIKCELDNQPCTAKVDYNLLREALMNIAMNAIEAMGEGGTLSFSVRRGHSTVEIAVSDTGVGMTEEELERAFDIFYSTKKNGAGFGLPTAKRILREHGGKIRIESAKGRGTTVRVTLPAAW